MEAELEEPAEMAVEDPPLEPTSEMEPEVQDSPVQDDAADDDGPIVDAEEEPQQTEEVETELETEAKLAETIVPDVEDAPIESEADVLPANDTETDVVESEHDCESQGPEQDAVVIDDDAPCEDSSEKDELSEQPEEALEEEPATESEQFIDFGILIPTFYEFLFESVEFFVEFAVFEF